MSLIPEKPLLVFPSMAATIGLEEAILLQVLTDWAHFQQTANSHHNNHQQDISLLQLQQSLPFWSAADLQRITNNLRAKGVLQISSAPISESGLLSFSLDAQITPTPHTAPRATHTPSGAPVQSQQKPASNLIANQWQPCRDTLRQLAQYNIPQAFIEQQIPEFVTYWSERGEPRYSWGSQFIKRVLRSWRDEQQKTARQNKESLMSREWQPSADALEILTRQAGINRNFCIDAVPEFVLYWQERGEPSSTWNTRFISHVKRQWARYTHTMEQDSEPRPLPHSWQPSESLFDVLSLANIPRTFAEAQLREFILYWQESGKVYASWNTKFLQHIKYQWARHQNWQQDSQHEQRQLASQPVSTRHRSLEDDLTDRSWAQ